MIALMIFSCRICSFILVLLQYILLEFLLWPFGIIICSTETSLIILLSLLLTALSLHFKYLLRLVFLSFLVFAVEWMVEFIVLLNAGNLILSSLHFSHHVHTISNFISWLVFECCFEWEPKWLSGKLISTSWFMSNSFRENSAFDALNCEILVFKLDLKVRY